MHSPNGISIVICTYNGVSRLEPTLKSIFALEIDNNIPWELLIIDNASSDNTFQFCEKLIEQNNFSNTTRILREPLAGCNYARHKGFNEASYKWLLFCDDDNILFPDYIKNAWPILLANSKIGVLGGQGLAIFEESKPEWFDRYSHTFAIGPQANKDGKINSSRAELYSAGTFFRKDLLLSYFNNNFSCAMVGRKGKEIFGGEDVEFCLLVQLLGFEIWYNSQLKFYHFMTKERMKWTYYLKLKAGISSTTANFTSYDPFFKKGSITKFSFVNNYLSKYIFYNINWLQFLVRSKIQPSRYSKEQFEIGQVVNHRKAASFRKDFGASYRHFLEIKKVLTTLKRFK